ncbi:MAG: hypothetical protein IJS39_17215 [Synergistaceae bacterium]|nr:hypothetical protein [Synergistaceae bacterium]
MRDFSKALENIRKAMREQDADFRREAGLGPKKPKPQPVIPSLEPDPMPQILAEGDRDPDRFLETSIASEPAPAPEIVEVLPQKDSRHSWLYNEVAKAVQNASEGNPNTKVVAVFVPVVQSGHELEELPVHETVELPPVHEEDFSVEDEIDIQDDPVAAEQEPAEPETPELSDELPLDSQEPEIPALPDFPEELSAEPEQAEHLGELIPESMEHPDPELAEAFTTMEEKLDESIAADQEHPETEEPAEISEEVSEFPEADISEFDIPEDEDYSEGEKMSFTEITPADDGQALPELDLPDELEDDEIIDDIDESSEDTKTL